MSLQLQVGQPRRWIPFGLTGLWLLVSVGAGSRQKLGVLRPVLGLESARGYLSRVLPESGFYSYEDFTYIKENTPESSRILIRDSVSYYLDRDYILMGGLFWYPGLSAGTLEDPARLRAALDDLGVTHFVIRKGRLGEPAPDKPWFQRLAKALESMPEIRLLRSSEFNNIYVLEN